MGFTREMKRGVKILWKQFIGYREQELNGESFLNTMENGTAFFHALIVGQKKIFGVI